MPKPGPSHWNGILSYCIKPEGVFSFHVILFMFLGHTNLEPCVLENTIVLHLCKITEPRKKQLKVEILHVLKEF